MDNFFYNLNDKLNAIRATPETTHKQLNERDEGKPGKNFAKIAKDAGERYGSKAAGERVAGAVRNKLKAQGKLEEEGMGDIAKKMGALGKKVGGAVLNKLGHGDDEVMRKDLQRKMGMPQTGKKPQTMAFHKSNTVDDNAVVANFAKEEYGPMEAGAPMTAKQKSFAKLAPPADKITFADKIAGAKKEVDERLGDVAAEAIKGALSPKQKKIDMNKNGKLDANDFAMLRKGGNKQVADEDSTDNAFTAHKRPRVDAPKVGTVDRGHKHDIEHTATGRKVTRRVDDQGHSVGADDASDAEPQKRGRGRPSGTGSKMGAKGPSGKSKLMTKENDRDPGEYDQEGEMAKDGIKTIVRHAQALEKILGDNDNLPEWVQSKLAKIESMMTAVDDYMQNQKGDEEMAMGEESTRKRDSHAERAGRKVTKDIEYDEKKKDGIHGKKRGSEDAKAEKAGKKVAKDIEYDEKKDKKEDKPKKVKEQGGAETPTASSGFSFGQGIYDSMNRELEKMIAENMQQSVAPGAGNKEALAKQIYDLGMSIHTNDRMYAQADPEGEAQLAKLKSQFAQQFPGEDPHKLGSAISHNEYQTQQQQKVAQIKQRPAGIMQKAKNALGGMFEDGEGAGNKEALAKRIYNLEMFIHRSDRTYAQAEPEAQAEVNKLKAQFAQQFPGEDAFKLGSAISHNEYQTQQQQKVAQIKQRPAGIMQKAKNALGGMYEGLNESMSVNMSDSTEGGKSLTITATDEDALKLAGLLKNAGLGGGEPMSQEMGHGDEHGEESCPSCGMNDCGCGDIDEALAENNPDWPTDQEGTEDAMMYSGGLNGPKSTGQSTIPVLASQEDRQHTYEDDEELRRMMEMAGVQQDNLKPWERTMKEDAEEDVEDTEDDAEDAEEKIDESFEQTLNRMRDIAGIKEAKKPDFLDIDKDGDKEEPMAKAAKDKEKKVEESIFALTNQWTAYKG